MSPTTAPAAPGRLGEPVDVTQLRAYLIALDGWLDARRAELAALDEAVRASEHPDDLTPDVALGLQLWQAIQTRYRRLLQVWDRGRVGVREREQLASLVWGRLDDEAWGGQAASGLQLFVGSGIGFVLGYISIAWLLKFVSNHSFAWFAAYRIPLGLIVMLLLATGVMQPV